MPAASSKKPLSSRHPPNALQSGKTTPFTNRAEQPLRPHEPAPSARRRARCSVAAVGPEELDLLPAHVLVRAVEVEHDERAVIDPPRRGALPSAAATRARRPRASASAEPRPPARSPAEPSVPPCALRRTRASRRRRRARTGAASPARVPPPAHIRAARPRCRGCRARTGLNMVGTPYVALRRAAPPARIVRQRAADEPAMADQPLGQMERGLGTTHVVGVVHDVVGREHDRRSRGRAARGAGPSAADRGARSSRWGSMAVVAIDSRRRVLRPARDQSLTTSKLACGRTTRRQRAAKRVGARRAADRTRRPVSIARPDVTEEAQRLEVDRAAPEEADASPVVDAVERRAPQARRWRPSARRSPPSLRRWPSACPVDSGVQHHETRGALAARASRLLRKRRDPLHPGDPERSAEIGRQRDHAIATAREVAGKSNAARASRPRPWVS